MKPPTFPNVAVVGMHFRGAEAKATVANFVPPVGLEIKREPDNQFDAFAIKVFYSGQHIGYIEGNQACFISPWIDQGHAYECVCHDLEARRNNLHPICTLTPIAAALLEEKIDTAAPVESA